jgi:hypothetical protein
MPPADTHLTVADLAATLAQLNIGAEHHLAVKFWYRAPRWTDLLYQIDAAARDYPNLTITRQPSRPGLLLARIGQITASGPYRQIRVYLDQTARLTQGTF